MSLSRHCPVGVLLMNLTADPRCLECPYPDCVGGAPEREARRQTMEAVRQALARGEWAGEIGRRLGISVRTVQRMGRQKVACR